MVAIVVSPAVLAGRPVFTPVNAILMSAGRNERCFECSTVSASRAR